MEEIQLLFLYQFEPERVVSYRTDLEYDESIAKKHNQDQIKEKSFKLDIQHGVNATNDTGKRERERAIDGFYVVKKLRQFMKRNLHDLT